MNVGKIAQFAMDGLKAVKSMPLAGKVAVGALFGIAGLTGVLIGDAFEKEEKRPNAIEPSSVRTSYDLPKEVLGKDGFVFELPRVGVAGVTKVDIEDTYPETNSPKSITYTCYGNNKQINVALKEDGSLDSYHVWINTNGGSYGTHYDSSGKVSHEGFSEYDIGLNNK